MTQAKESSKKRWNTEIIIDAGRTLFYKKGFNLSMRDLARELDTRPSSLYRHVKNKRDLWFAIINEDFKLFNNELMKIAQSHKGNSLDLLKKTGQFFLEFARQDFNRFRLMFLFEPPNAEDDSGPFEKACNPQSLIQMKLIVEQIIKEEKLSIKASDYFTYALFSYVLGAAVINSPINAYLLEDQTIMDEHFDNFIIQLIDSIIIGLRQKD